jgi:hypothetical protein
MTVIRHFEQGLAALAFAIGLGWPVAEIIFHATR